MTRNHAPAFLVLIVAVWLISGIAPPSGHLVWLLENAPAMAATAVMVWTRRRYPLSQWVYGSLFIHALILAYGGYYTYAEVPAGNWVRDTFHLARNHYDRLGHVAQGFFPSFVAREIYVRRSPLQSGYFLAFAILTFALALSASYELLEGVAAYFVTSAAGDAFLGTQGDIWDTQWDMFCALCGGGLAQLPPLTRLHDRSMSRVDSSRR